MVVETSLGALPEIGYVCSGGRYDELASLYTERKMPGVGASIGLDRLIAALETIGKINDSVISTQVLIMNQEKGNAESIAISELHALAAHLRDAGFSCEVFPEEKKTLAQYTYAERKHIPLALFANSAKGPYNLRILAQRKNIECLDFDSLCESIRSSLNVKT